jgi:hypothetical protein
LVLAFASARAAAAKILVYSAVTEFPILNFFLLAAVADREVTPLATVLKHETHRQLDCDGAARDHMLCIIGTSLSRSSREVGIEERTIGLPTESDGAGFG